MFCGECGATNLDGAKFCEECGAALIKNEPTEPMPSRFTHAKILALRRLLAGLVAITIVVGGYFWWSNRYDDVESVDLHWPIPMKIGGNYQFLDRNGKLLPPKYEFAFRFHGDNVTPVVSNGLVGYADKLGNIVIEPKFDSAFGFDKYGYAPIMFDKHWGWIDRSGKIVIKPRYEAAGGNIP